MSAVASLRAKTLRALAVVKERWPAWYRLLRYSAASCIVAPMTLVLLFLLHGVAGWEAWHANLLSVSVGAVPAYLIDRYWVWSRSGRNRLWGEIVPFWVITVVGAAISTVGVNAASRWDNSGLIVLVNFGTYAVLWLVKFFVLDRCLWPSRRAPSEEQVHRPAGAAGA
ncbi:MAG: GtrA family protein [Acidimicrobiia bacterium]|nr:GtrA family protein [Acidimicrobiia bacterium]